MEMVDSSHISSDISVDFISTQVPYIAVIQSVVGPSVQPAGLPVACALLSRGCHYPLSKLGDTTTMCIADFRIPSMAYSKE